MFYGKLIRISEFLYSATSTKNIFTVLLLQCTDDKSVASTPIGSSSCKISSSIHDSCYFQACVASFEQ